MTYKKLLVNIVHTAKHPYHGLKLEDTLAEWAQSGLYVFSAFYCNLPTLTFY